MPEDGCQGAPAVEGKEILRVDNMSTQSGQYVHSRKKPGFLQWVVEAVSKGL